jgi:hypothetical protein
LFPGQPGLRRDDNLKFYDLVTSKGIDLPKFEQEGTALRVARESRGAPPNVFSIEVGHFQGNFRFLVADEWPTKPLSVFKENADIAWACFQEVWPHTRLGGTPTMVETNFRMTAAAEGGNATAYLIDRCFRLSHAALGKLGRNLQGVGLRLVFPVEIPREGEDIPLAAASANIRIETLLDDPSLLYFEMNTKWPSVPVPKEIQKATGAPEYINPEILQPTEYLDKSYDYLTLSVADFLAEAERS